MFAATRFQIMDLQFRKRKRAGAEAPARAIGCPLKPGVRASDYGLAIVNHGDVQVSQ